MGRKFSNISILEKNSHIPWEKFSKEYQDEAACLETIQHWDARFYLELIDGVLKLGQKGLGLGSIYVDFKAKWDYHQRFYKSKGFAKEPLYKACLLKERPSILDASAGMGSDSLLLCFLGAQVHMLERNPVVAALLVNGLSRFKKSNPKASKSLSFAMEDSSSHQGGTYDVIYYDPMYQSPNKKTAPKKQMRIFRELLDHEDEEFELEKFCGLAKKRVVVKRALRADSIWPDPDINYQGKSTRYDVYLC